MIFIVHHTHDVIEKVHEVFEIHYENVVSGVGVEVVDHFIVVLIELQANYFLRQFFYFIMFQFLINCI